MVSVKLGIGFWIWNLVFNFRISFAVFDRIRARISRKSQRASLSVRSGIPRVTRGREPRQRLNEPLDLEL